MKVMTSPSASVISFSTAFSRSSNSPRYLAPATIEPRSRPITRLPFRPSGTSPSTMRWARPSTMAVLPTPGSPMRTGLFLVRRESTWITRRISSSRPMTGSIFPWRASAVRSRPYFSRAWNVSSGSGEVTRWLPRTSRSALAAVRRGPPRAGRPWPAAGARPRGTRRPCRSAARRPPRGRRAGRGRSWAPCRRRPGAAGPARRRPGRASTAGSTPTRARMGPAMPSGWASTAASTWAGVTSAWWPAVARSTAAAKASWVLSGPAVGSMGIVPTSSSAAGGASAGGGRARGRRHRQPGTAAPGRAGTGGGSRPPPRGPRPGWRSSSARSRATSASSSSTRRTPSRLSPSSVRLLDAAEPVEVALAEPAAAALGAAGSSRPLRS